jgi:cob(I)alamin adenosyltransferase
MANTDGPRQKGLVHLYTGNGKGKTSAAIGLGVRARGRGYRVCLCQFMKGQETGEELSLAKLQPGFDVLKNRETDKFIWNMNDDEIAALKIASEKLFRETLGGMMAGKWDMVIFDEIISAVTENLIPLTDVLRCIAEKPASVELVLTGRNAPEALIEKTDYVTELVELKHPFARGISAREGIEY